MTLSICIPCLNSARTLPHTWTSVLEQSSPPEEVIFADNGSTDNTLDLCNQFANMEIPFRVKVLHFQQPLGMSNDWNRIIRESACQATMLLPSDDLLLPGALAFHKATILDPSVAISAVPKKLLTASGYLLPGSIRRLPYGKIDRNKAISASLFRCENAIGEPGAVVFKRRQFDEVGGFDSGFRYYPDVDLWIRLLNLGDLYFARRPGVAFRVHGNSLTRTNLARARVEWIRLFQRHAKKVGLESQPSRSLHLRSAVISLLRAAVFRVLSSC